jgi:hypothetical protein
VLTGEVPLAATPPCLGSEETPAAGLTKAEFVRLSERLRLKNQPWARIPWKSPLPKRGGLLPGTQADLPGREYRQLSRLDLRQRRACP